MSQRHTVFSMGKDTAETLSRRLPMMVFSPWPPSASLQAEMMKMVIEKQMAVLETCFALQMEAVKAMVNPWWMLDGVAQAKAADAALQVALAPAGRRVKANARRLRRR